MKAEVENNVKKWQTKKQKIEFKKRMNRRESLKISRTVENIGN